MIRITKVTLLDTASNHIEVCATVLGRPVKYLRLSPLRWYKLIGENYNRILDTLGIADLEKDYRRFVGDHYE